MKEVEARGRSLAGAAALVSGGGSGIGRAIAVGLGGLGMHVILAGRRLGPLEETARRVEAAGGAARPHACDLTVDGEVVALARAAGEQGRGRLAVLVHAAARHLLAPFERTPVEQLDELLRSNLRAPFLLTRHALPLLRAARGDLVFVNSSAALAAGAQVSAYAASKAALKALADGLRAELNPDGVRVLSVFAGRTASPMQAEIFRQEGREYRPERLLQPEEVAAAVVGAVSLPDTAELFELHIRPARKP